MRRKVSLFMTTVFCMFVNLHVFGEITLPVPLTASLWDTHKASGADVYNEDGSLVLEVLSNADPAWQGICYYVLDLDLDVYPNCRVTTSEESTSEWSVKLLYSGFSDQKHALGGDLSVYGQREFAVEDIIEESGVVSFELYLWAIGTGRKAVFTQLEFFGEGGSATVNNVESENVSIVYVKKGGIVFNSVIDKSISISSINGTLIKQFNAKSTSIDDLQSGLYIVKVGTKVIKVFVP